MAGAAAATAKSQRAHDSSYICYGRQSMQLIFKIYV